MSIETELCAAVTLHAARVRELLADLKLAKLDSPKFYEAYGALTTRAEFLAKRAEELATLCKKEKTA